MKGHSALLLKSHLECEVPQACDWAYAAGFFDGEGCVSVSQQTRQAGIRNFGYWQVRPIISNTDFPLLKWMHTSFGGTVHFHRNTKIGWRVQYQWFTTGSAHSIWFLSGMLPYLKIKKTEAELAIQFFRCLLGKTGGKLLPLAEREKRQEIVQKIRAIPGRGGRWKTGGKLVPLEITEVPQRHCLVCSRQFIPQFGSERMCSEDCKKKRRTFHRTGVATIRKLNSANTVTGD